MIARTIEFDPIPAHPWTPIVSDVVGNTILRLPVEVQWDAAAMADYLNPHEYRYHAMVEEGRLLAFGALQAVATRSPGRDMRLMYLGAAPNINPPDVLPEMLRRLEGASRYMGATLLRVFPAEHEAAFYKKHGYKKYPEIAPDDVMKLLY